MFVFLGGNLWCLDFFSIITTEIDSKHADLSSCVCFKCSLVCWFLRPGITDPKGYAQDGTRVSVFENVLRAYILVQEHPRTKPFSFWISKRNCYEGASESWLLVFCLVIVFKPKGLDK